MTTHFALDSELLPLTPGVNLDPNHIEFGRVFVPSWLTCRYASGKWGPPTIEPLDSIPMHPAAIVFHYGQAIFEGLKAYKGSGDSVHLFRPIENARRFNRSAERMLMPAFDEHLFVESIQALVRGHRNWVPSHPGSLYVRPAMIATEPCIGVRGASEFLFFVLTLPTGSYFPQSAGIVGPGAVRVYVSTKVGRAAIGGTGDVKAGVNYAVTLQVIAEGKKKGCPQVLFLDSQGHRRIEEMGGMNVFFLVDGKLITPKTSGTILAGITRDSILQLAPDLGIPVLQADLTLDEVLAGLASGRITEAFACGTAAVICGIGELLMDSGETVTVGSGQPGPITTELHTALTEIQFGKRPDTHNWIVPA